MTLQDHLANGNYFISNYYSGYGHQTWQNDNLPWSHVSFWPCGFARSRDKLRLLYLHYHSAIATKLGVLITYLDGLLPIKSLDPLIVWSCQITWQTKSIISPIPQCLWPPNLAGWYLILRGSYRYSHLIL